MSGGTACCWMTLGDFHPRPAAASASCVLSPSSSKALMAAARSVSLSEGTLDRPMSVFIYLRAGLRLSRRVNCWCAGEDAGVHIRCASAYHIT
jgi:hypothetical protein